MPSTATRPPEPGETIIRRTTTTTHAAKGAWWPWLLALLLIPAGLALLASLTDIGRRDAVQDDLTAKSRTALASAGITGADVTFDGVVGRITGVPPGQEDRARQAVEGVSGVWSAEVVGGSGADSGPGTAPTAPTAPTTPAAPVQTEPFSVQVVDGTVTLSGQVPDEETKAKLIASASAAAGGRPIVDELTVAPGAVLPASADALAAAIGSPALAGSAGTHGVSWDGDAVTLTGSVASEQEKAAAQAVVAQVAPGATVDNQLTVAPPPVDKAALQQQIAALIASQPITFQPNTAELTPAGAQSVQQVAAVLRGAPTAAVEVGGHIAGTPGNSLDGQALSEQRAAAVQAQLAAQGVAADKITAKGYGDTRPVASNDTAQGQAANRRVEITVL